MLKHRVGLLSVNTGGGGRKVARFLPVPCLSLGFAGRDAYM